MTSYVTSSGVPHPPRRAASTMSYNVIATADDRAREEDASNENLVDAPPLRSFIPTQREHVHADNSSSDLLQDWNVKHVSVAQRATNFQQATPASQYATFQYAPYLNFGRAPPRPPRPQTQSPFIWRGIQQGHTQPATYATLPRMTSPPSLMLDLPPPSNASVLSDFDPIQSRGSVKAKVAVFEDHTK